MFKKIINLVRIFFFITLQRWNFRFVKCSVILHSLSVKFIDLNIDVYIYEYK